MFYNPRIAGLAIAVALPSSTFRSRVKGRNIGGAMRESARCFVRSALDLPLTHCLLRYP
jgi:hypothetical protein